MPLTCVSRFHKFRCVLNRLASTTVDLLQKLGELARNVGGVTIKNRSITSANLARVLKKRQQSVTIVLVQARYFGRRARRFKELTFSTITCALKDSAPLGGSVLESPATLPRRISFTDTFLTLKPTLSPGRPSTSCSWCLLAFCC